MAIGVSSAVAGILPQSERNQAFSQRLGLKPYFSPNWPI